MMRNYRHSHGFTLLELLLVVAVLGLLTASAAAIFDQWFKDSIDRKVAREMQQLQNAAEAFVGLNISDVRGRVPAVGDVVELDITADFINNGFLPTGYDATNSYRQSMRVFVTYTTSGSVNGDVFEVITVSDNVGAAIRRIDNSRLFRAATRSGQKSIGLISDLNISATCCNGNIQSANGEWSIPLSLIAAAPTPYTATPDADGGYMAAYGRVFTKDILTENYLYRFDVPEIVNANRMETDLDITNNDIENAGILVIDSIEAVNATVSGNSFSRLPGQYTFATDSGLNVGNDLIVNAGADEQNGNISIIGDNGVAVDFVISGNMNVLNAATGRGDVAANQLFASGVTVAGESNFVTVDNNNSNVTAGNIFADQGIYSNAIQVNNNMQASSVLNANTVTSGSSAIGQAQINTVFSVPNNLQVDQNMNVSGNVNVGSGVLGTDEVTINTLIRPCGSDCP